MGVLSVVKNVGKALIAKQVRVAYTQEFRLGAGVLGAPLAISNACEDIGANAGGCQGCAGRESTNTELI